ncbi:DUF1801 domain-containing protein [Jejuia spongiicola]|uniref:DUF1801 domain-containing protein n=1 Tax=Jejuia spongiicola TaxID=2942207 RepID=A0ABT0QBC5_9FLAO|nr:DUF1801 domain-containing protein [Jejuia spongiicola]MCL6294281.1 DUF1801 domain-containing protein [Jejuia spongiicola]
MANLQINTNPKVEVVFNNYPDSVRSKLLHLRHLIIETANDIAEITTIEETIKWGEPSFLTKKGSTIRINQKKGEPNQYAMYFQCTSKLIPTFKMIYKDTFTFEGSRAMVFNINSKIPEEALKNCITAALMYHKVKHLPNLGM